MRKDKEEKPYESFEEWLKDTRHLWIALVVLIFLIITAVILYDSGII